MKRQWGFDYILTKKTKARASADVGFIFIAYNLRRIFNIVGKDMLMAYMMAVVAVFVTVKTKISPYISLKNQMDHIWATIWKLIIFHSAVEQNQKIRKMPTFNLGF